MRAIRCILGFSFFLAVLLESARGKTCLSHSECREDECCMTKSALLGGCRSRAREGGSCLPEIPKSNIGDMFMMSCPCLDNLVCVPSAVVENKEDRTVQYLNSTCQTTEALLNLYKRLLKSDVHPKLLISVLKNIIG